MPTTSGSLRLRPRPPRERSPWGFSSRLGLSSRLGFSACCGCSSRCGFSLRGDFSAVASGASSFLRRLEGGHMEAGVFFLHTVDGKEDVPPVRQKLGVPVIRFAPGLVEGRDGLHLPTRCRDRE